MQKQIFTFIDAVLDTIPSLIIESCYAIVDLQSSDHKETRRYAIGLLGKAIKHCVDIKGYNVDRLSLFNLLESHLFDKASSCRKRAFELIKVIAHSILEIINPEGAIQLYTSILNAVTDPKPSIRKLAVDVIVDLTRLYIEKFEISSDEESWDERYQISQNN